MFYNKVVLLKGFEHYSTPLPEDIYEEINFQEQEKSPILTHTKNVSQLDAICRRSCRTITPEAVIRKVSVHEIDTARNSTTNNSSTGSSIRTSSESNDSCFDSYEIRKRSLSENKEIR